MRNLRAINRKLMNQCKGVHLINRRKLNIKAFLYEAKGKRSKKNLNALKAKGVFFWNGENSERAI